MGRKFIAERGQKISRMTDRLIMTDRQLMSDIPLMKRLKSLFKQKKQKEYEHSTIKGYYDTVRYFKDWLSDDIEYIDQITPTMIRKYINYLKNDRLPYQGDNQRERS